MSGRIARQVAGAVRTRQEAPDRIFIRSGQAAMSGLPAAVFRHVSAADRLREGIHGTVWASHLDDADDVIGWEMRCPRYKGFFSGGRKSLFAFGASDPARVAVAEPFIDAAMARSLHDNAHKARPLVAWVVETRSQHSDKVTARLTTDVPSPYVLVADTLAEIHAALPPALKRSARRPVDPPDVVEIWFGT